MSYLSTATSIPFTLLASVTLDQSLASEPGPQSCNTPTPAPHCCPQAWLAHKRTFPHYISHFYWRKHERQFCALYNMLFWLIS